MVQQVERNARKHRRELIESIDISSEIIIWKSQKQQMEKLIHNDSQWNGKSRERYQLQVQRQPEMESSHFKVKRLTYQIKH